MAMTQAAERLLVDLEIQYLEGEMVRYLAKHGPTPFAELIVALGGKRNHLIQALLNLKASTPIYSYRADSGRCSGKTWSLQPKPPAQPKPAKEQASPDKWITAEDMAWMERYQRRRQARIELAERMAAR